MKKVMAFMLSLLMMVSVSSVAFAANHESIAFPAEPMGETLYISSYACPPQYSAFAVEKIGAFLVASEFSKYDNCRLGTPFTFANSGADIYYFPVYSSGEIICLLRVYSNARGEIAGVLSKGFANELNMIATQTSARDPLCIYMKDSDIVFKTSAVEQTVFSYPRSIHELETASIPEDSAKKIVVESDANHASLIELPQTMQSRASKNLSLFGSSNKPPEVQASNEEWCAAYSTAAIMRYKGMNGLYAINIMEYFYGANPSVSDMLSLDQIYTYATIQSFWVTKSESTLSFDRLCEEIDYNRPVYISMRRQVGSTYKYHAVVLCGYNDTSGMMRIWNPRYEYYETIYSLYNYVPSEDSSRTYEYARTIWNWSR